MSEIGACCICLHRRWVRGGSQLFVFPFGKCINTFVKIFAICSEIYSFSRHACIKT